MKYQSEIIAEIVEKRGHEKSSLHYESECKETWIKENEGAYPKLIDYEGEWLNYINENPIGEFPYQSLTDVTYATVENVVPYAYKSAILKGQTLVNLSPFTSKIALSLSNNASEHKKLSQPLNQNTKYILIFNINNSTSSLASDYIMVRGYNTDGAFKEYGRTTKNFGNGRHYILLESTQGNVERIFIASNFSCEIDDTILAIYQDGMENWDIPYFTGMQSVKMPVLTTTGKNMLDTNQNLYVGYDLINISNEKDKSYRKTQRNFIKKGTYTITCNNEDYVIRVTVSSASSPNVKTFDSANSETNYRKSVKLTLDEDSLYVINFKKNITDVIIDEINLSMLNVQTEESPTATSYEPYKTNILTVNEDVTLRSNGDIYDELNLLTGRLTQRIDENNEVLAQEVVKTVDLTSINEKGEQVIFKPIEGTMHISTSGETIKPTFTGEIPVEAITQNLESFIGDE